MDDVDIMLKGLDPGVRYDEQNDTMVIENDKVETDKNVPEDERTMRELSKIGSSLHSSISTTPDFPSLHPDGMMPLLDMKTWVDENGRRFTF